MLNAAEPQKTKKTVGGLPDRPAKVDGLGFRPYVAGIAAFLMDPKTEAPLTLSVEGEWGTGKSSFLLQLQDRLKKANKLTVFFNAWRHDKEDALWAAFALIFIRELSDQIGWPQRVTAKLRLRWCRYDWEEGWLRFVLFVLGMILFTALPVIYISRHGFNGVAEIVSPAGELSFIRVLYLTGGAGYLALGVYILRKLKDVFVNPITEDLKRYVNAPDYKAHSDFIEDFHKDFSDIVEAYAGSRRVFVFIDDLDRCEVPKAADLMQALNLMISDSSRLIFTIGMDREKVAAGIAVKYKELLPYLAPSPDPLDPTEKPDPTPDAKSRFDPVAGLEFGYSFIEKFVQLPFQVPQPVAENIEQMVNSFVGRSALSADSGNSQSDQNDDLEEITDAEDSSVIPQLIRITAPAFDYNPRRIKQFINVFRLRRHIAVRTNLFAPPDPPTGYDSLTPERLGKFVAITLRWPLLVADLQDDHELLSKLQFAAWGEERPLQFSDRRFARWRSKPQLIQLLKEGFSKRDKDPDGTAKEGDDTILRQEKLRYALTNMNIAKLFQVSPPLTRPLPATTPESDLLSVVHPDPGWYEISTNESGLIEARPKRDLPAVVPEEKDDHDIGAGESDLLGASGANLSAVVHTDPGSYQISSNKPGLIEAAAAGTNKQAGDIETERMGHPPLTLRQLLLPAVDGSSQPSARQQEFQESITKGVSEIGGIPELADQIRDSLDIDIVSILVHAWKRTLDTTLDESRKAAGEVTHLALAEHTINSEHHPYIEMRLRKASIKRIEFRLMCSFWLKDFSLKIQDGSIKEILTGSCEAECAFQYEGLMIAQMGRTPIKLPASILVSPNPDEFDWKTIP